ncbi:M4 family metallopeptidase, partial [Streptomyces massasporeus]
MSTSVYARQKRATLAIATAVAAGALLTTGLTSGSSAAADSASKPALAAAPVLLSAPARTALIQEQQADATKTADEIGLGAQEKLVVKDVVKDADGSVHTRYERTYAGLPVLGGDLVVHQSKSGAAKGVTRATKAALKVTSLKPEVTAAKAEKQAVTLAKAAGSAKTEASSAPRKVIWAASGKPVLAYETVVGGLQEDGTPNELHVVTDAATGKKLYEYQGIETGTGNTTYSGSVTLTTTKSGSTYNLTDSTRGGHKTYNLNRGTSGTGTLFSGSDDVWGTGNPSNAETAAADAHYGAQITWDFYKSAFGRNGIRNDGKAAYSRVHYGNAYVNAFWSDSCFCMTYGDGSGNTNPLTSLDVAAHEMSHGLTSATAGLNYSGESGGLNEATSDIFGAGAEFFANNSSDVGDYLIGEEIDINGDGTPLRYMDKPSKD